MEILLDGARVAHAVHGGAADLFAVRHEPGGVTSRRHLVARLPAGSSMPGATVSGQWTLVLVPLPGTDLRPVEQADTSVDAALRAIGHAPWRTRPPRGTPTLHDAGRVHLQAGHTLAANAEVRWVKAASSDLTRNGCALVVPAGDFAALAGYDWVRTDVACTVETFTTAELLAGGLLDTALARWLAGLHAEIDRRTDAGHVLRGIADRKRADSAALATVARQSVSVLGVPAGAVPLSTGTPLDRHARAVEVLAVVVDHPGLRVPTDAGVRSRDERQALAAVARASALHTRELVLPDRWRSRDLGPLVAWRTIDTEGGARVRAVPLVFRRGRYHEVDPETRTHTPAREDLAATATTVQQPVPREGGLGALLRIGLSGARRDARTVLLSGLLIALLGLATPLVSGAVLGDLAGDGALGSLAEVSALLLVSAVLAALVGVAHNLLFLRIEGRAESGTQLAVWDRLLRLPVRYFGQTTAGELANIVLGIAFVREALGALVSQAVFAVLTSVAAIGLLLWIEPPVAALALGVVAVTALTTIVLGTLVARRQQQALPAEHRLAGLTNQLLSGVARVKLAAAEDRAYAHWVAGNIAARRGLQRVRVVQAALLTVSAALPMSGQLVLLSLLAGPLAGQVAPGDFFVIQSAFLAIVGMMLVIITTSVEAVALLPRVRDLAKVTDAVPEHRVECADPGELDGEIEVRDIGFSYTGKAPFALDGVSLHIRPGQFVAIVGPSGCGKSTLLRLLLGFERPQRGSIRYDGQDLADLDAAAVRRQCGVVLQDGQLFAGTIRENIAGAGNYPLDRVWDAARMAGIDADIAGLPMGMNTAIPLGGGTLSVGQRQRLLIARALVRRPRILFFDEATCSLDNRNQEIVTASTMALAATRVVIAPRLSTIAAADLIVVLDQGRVVEQGRYEDLIRDESGLFHRLAQRQILREP
jgi:NHLM bacteriocin system ABC transporter ATP-binding protein